MKEFPSFKVHNINANTLLDVDRRRFCSHSCMRGRRKCLETVRLIDDLTNEGLDLFCPFSGNSDVFFHSGLYSLLELVVEFLFPTCVKSFLCSIDTTITIVGWSNPRETIWICQLHLVHRQWASSNFVIIFVIHAGSIIKNDLRQPVRWWDIGGVFTHFEFIIFIEALWVSKQFAA